MKVILTRVLLLGAVAAVAISLGLLLNSIPWAIACASLCLLAALIYDDLSFRRWIKRPQQSSSKLSPVWRDTGDAVAATLRSGRSRTRAVLNELQQVRSVSDFIPDGWVILRETNGIELFNGAAATLMGLTESDIGRDLNTVVRSPTLSRLLHNDNELEIVETSSPANDAVRLELRLVLLENKRKLVVARDVTELNRLLSMRQDFIANVSHELRTPLTVLIGYIETMAEDDLDEDMLKDLVGRLVTPVNRMRSMVDDLLTLTTLESSPLPDASDVKALHMKTECEKVLEEARQLATRTHTIDLAVEDELYIECVPKEIHSAVMNLVTNAIRYTPEGGTIQIRCYKKGQFGCVEVEDDGVGIPPESISRLTERFYRIDLKGSRAGGGTGLGLAIVKHVLRRHNSELQVRSDVGSGSQFSFQLPLQINQQQVAHNGLATQTTTSASAVAES